MNTSTIFTINFTLITIATSIVVIVLIIIGTKSASQQTDFASAQETRRLYFASCVVSALGYVFTTGMLMAYLGNEKGTPLFDGVKTIIPPIITLVLGYYFGSAKQPDQGRKRKPAENPEKNQPTD